MDRENLDEASLEYHRAEPPGKLRIEATKPLTTQRDLALAYSPGVAAACRKIAKDPLTAADYTARSNLVAVISNGTAVLGLGNIGALAGKPVMEGKAVLFKKFAGIDVFDIEIEEREPLAFIDTVTRLEPTFGAINLEDIKAPECFIIEKALRERMKIPVFHDDQHGTAIVCAAAVTNALKLVEKSIETVKIVCSGAGAAALACLDLLVSLGAKKENIFVTDIVGVVYEGRTEQWDEYKARYAQKTDARALGDVIVGADLFLGLSAPNVLKPEMVKEMAPNPMILALANPDPEIRPEEARAVRPDALIATGRSDYPNQVNNVLCFPFIFRGALDVGATTINEEMKKACVYAIAELTRKAASDVVTRAYGGQSLTFGRDYLLPKPFDPRLMVEIAPKVAKAAMDTRVATRPIQDFRAYHERLSATVFRTGYIMKPVFDLAKEHPKRLALADGEEDRILQASQQIVGEGIARPVLIGRRAVIERRIGELSLSIAIDQDFDVVEPSEVADTEGYAEDYYRLRSRDGIRPEEASLAARSDPSVFSGLMLRRGEVDAVLCGPLGRYHRHLSRIQETVGMRPGIRRFAALQVLILPRGTYFMVDTHANEDSTPEDVAEQTRLAAEEVRRFGVVPKVALLSYSNFGSRLSPAARKMKEALRIIRDEMPTLEIEGEMQADLALSEALRSQTFPHSELRGQANLLVMPSVDAGNIAFNLLKQLGGGVSVGPIILGAAQSIHILTTSVTVRGILNMAAVACTASQRAR